MDTTNPSDAPAIAGQILIELVRHGNQVRLSAQSTMDLFTSLGVLESAKDILKQQAQGPAPSPLVVARGNVPRA